MTMFTMADGRTVGWCPDDDPYTQYDDEHGWYPVLEGKLVVMLPDDDPEKQRAIASLATSEEGAR